MKNTILLLLLLATNHLLAQQDYTVGLSNKDGFANIYKTVTTYKDPYNYNNKTETRYGLMEIKTQKTVLPVLYRMVYTSMEDNIYVVKDTLDMFSLFNAQTKTFITAPEYAAIDYFSEDLVVVRKPIPNSYSNVCGAIDKTGKVIIPVEYDYLGRSAEGLLNFRKDDAYGFINKQNKVVIPNLYKNASDFGDGLAPACLKDAAQYGYINAKNVFVIAPQYAYAENFYAGYAGVYKSKGSRSRAQGGDEMGIINTTGKTIVEPLYENVSIKRKGGVFVVRQKDKYGMVDSTGKTILPVNYKKVGEFNNNGYAIVEETGGTSGMIDSKGNFVLPAEYTELYGSYTSDYFIAKKDGKYTVMDSKLKVLVTPDTAKRVLSEKNNFALIYTNMVKIFDAGGKPVKTIQQEGLDMYGVRFMGDKIKDSIRVPYFSKMVLINLQGNTQTKIPGYDISDFNEEGIFVVNDNDYSFYDYTAKKLSTKKYNQVVNFSEGIAGLKETSTSTPYLADKNFNKIMDLTAYYTGPFSEGIAATKGQYDGTLYYIDKTGKTVFSIKAKEGYACKNRRIVVMNDYGKYLYITKEGKPLNNATYDLLGLYTEGLAGFKNNNKFGFIDTAGNVAINADYDAATSFTSGVTMVKKGTDFFLINKKGQPVTTDKYIEATDCANGTFPAKKASGYGLLNTLGKPIIEFKYESILPEYDDMIWARLNGKWGVLNATGKAITAFEYDNVENFNNGYAKVQQGKKLGLINKAGKIVLPVLYDKLSTVYKNMIIGYLPSGSNMVSVK
ncbi:WG repeat-containing protein [Ferruginibacter sp. SUN106]|uniref:WG repeat-containing protein n=1 Tax=Ferruginibacter sp. SUN106 TaxID=2978348 RepID=UPI003D35AB76